MGFREIALPLAAKGVPCTPVLPNSKKAFLPNFPETATTDLAQIAAWDAAYPNHNGACVARPRLDEVWFFEVDSREVVSRIESETGQTMPDTLRVRSRPGRGHFYFRQTPSSIAMGNISQSYVKNQDWSARVDNQYVVAPGSAHPMGGFYEMMRDEPINPAPEWLIQWLLSQKITKSNAPIADVPRNEAGLIPHGAIHGYMLTQAGKLRNMGLGVEAIAENLLELVHKNCQPPIDDEKVRQMARSVGIYEPGGPTELALTQIQAPAPAEELEPLVFDEGDYPAFPTVVMEGTSIYENFVKPICDQNSRIAEFMWVPATMMMMNYLGNKVTVWGKDFRPNFYTVIIGRKGKTNKSSSVQDGMKYLEYAGILSHASRDAKMAEGKSLMWSAGSPEGLGADMQRTNCKNAILFYDELSQLVNKAGIDGSTLSTALLTMYESGKFQNIIKSKKDSFSIEPGSYCATVICCTTDEKFADLWSKMAGEDSGLNDRFFFLLQPETLPETKLFTLVNTNEGVAKTRQLIDKAVAKGNYHFFDQSPFEEIARVHGNRTEIRAEKWALAFAIDLGKDEIDEDCVERAVLITKYEVAVKKYMKTFEARNEEALIQQKIMSLLEKSKGRMPKREMDRKIHPGRFGTTRFEMAYGGLIKYGYIREEGAGTRNEPKFIHMLRRLASIGEDDE